MMNAHECRVPSSFDNAGLSDHRSDSREPFGLQLDHGSDPTIPDDHAIRGIHVRKYKGYRQIVHQQTFHDYRDTDQLRLDTDIRNHPWIILR